MVQRSLLDACLRYKCVRLLAAALVATALAAGCADPNLMSGPQFTSRGGKVTGQRIYHLGVGDKLKVSVFGEDNLSGQFEVSALGQISMPLIGEVQAYNLTTAELDQRLTAKLG